MEKNNVKKTISLVAKLILVLMALYGIVLFVGCNNNWIFVLSTVVQMVIFYIFELNKITLFSKRIKDIKSRNIVNFIVLFVIMIVMELFIIFEIGGEEQSLVISQFLILLMLIH